MGGSDDGDAHTTIDISANFGVGFLPLLCEQAESLFRRILASLLLRLIPSVVDSTSSSSIQFLTKLNNHFLVVHAQYGVDTVRIERAGSPIFATSSMDQHVVCKREFGVLIDKKSRLKSNSMLSHRPILLALEPRRPKTRVAPYRRQTLTFHHRRFADYAVWIESSFHLS
jgi:hypothetical protein